MQPVHLSAEDAKQKIQDMDLSAVERRLVNVEGCSPEDAREATDCYRRLLTLQAMYPDHALVPPAPADRALHAHILQTRRYAEDMQSIFGRFLHHEPDATSEERREFTRQVFLEHFGLGIEAFAICTIAIEQKRAA